MNANLLISAGATAATSPVMTLDSMAASGGVTSSAGSALFMMPTPSMQFQTEPVRWTSEDMAVLTALSLDATAAAVPTSAADPRASDDAMAPLTPNFVLPWDSPATLAAMIDRAVAEASVAAPSQTSSSSTITSPATSSGTDSRPVVMARRSFLLDDDQSAATISSSATSPLRFSSSSRCQQRSDDACDCCHDDDHTAAGDLPRSQMLEPSQCRPVGTEPWSIQAAGPVHKLWSTAVDAAGMTLTARTEAPAEPLPLGRCRQMAYRTDGTARVVLTTLLPDAEFQSQEPSRRPNRLVVMDVELRDGRSGGTDNDMGTSAAASATASAASAAEGGRPAVPTLSTKYQAGLAFDSLVRAFCIIPSDRGDQHVAVASGDQVSLWRLTENDSDAAEFLPLWSKNGGRQVRDMARRHNLLAWGGNVGRLRCLDLSRPEDPSKSFLVAEFYARSLHQSIASIRWRPEDSACVVSLTTDSGDFQVRDIRDRHGGAQLEKQMTTVPLYSHDWIDENLLLVGGGAGMLGLWDTRMLDQPANSWQLAGHRVLGDVNLHGSTTSGCVFSTGGYGAGLFHVAAESGNITCHIGNGLVSDAATGQIQRCLAPLGPINEPWIWMQASSDGSMDFFFPTVAQ